LDPAPGSPDDVRYAVCIRERIGANEGRRDALVTVTRTRSALRRASAESTYLGLEGGFGFPVYGWGDSILSVRPGIGIARRIDGIGTWSDRATFTWNVGASLMLPTAWFASGR